MGLLHTLSYFQNAYSVSVCRHSNHAYIHLHQRCELVCPPRRLCSVEALSNMTAESWRCVGGLLVNLWTQSSQTKRCPTSLLRSNKNTPQFSLLVWSRQARSAEGRYCLNALTTALWFPQMCLDQCVAHSETDVVFLDESILLHFLLLIFAGPRFCGVVCGQLIKRTIWLPSLMESANICQRP